MIAINVESEIREKVQPFSLGILGCNIINTPTSDGVWSLITQEIVKLRESKELNSINKNPNISATRAAYKVCGKDPNRYRPSAEALCRRILKGMDLYRINTVVDLVNLVSFKSGYSIGGFDENKIEGNKLTLGIGKANEPFEGIGRGLLNIDGLPVYRDSIGGVGTPTSDNERTKLSEDTTQLLMIINGYSGTKGLDEWLTYSKKLLTEYASASNIETRILEF